MSPRALLCLVLAAACAVQAAPPAAAHASAEKAFPTPGASLDQSPGLLWVVLSETPDLATFKLQLLDGNHREVPLGPVRLEGDRLVASVPTALPEGGYVARWSALDALDGHVAKGSWSFVMGSGAALDPASGTDGFSWPAALAKGLAFVGLSLAAGGVATRALVLPRGVQGGALARLSLSERAGAGLLVAGLALLLFLQAGAADLGLVGYATATLSGRGLSLRVLLAAALLGWVLAGPRSAPWARTVDLALLGVLLVATGGASHAAAALEPWALGTAVDALHLGAIAVWTGGLACLALLLGDDLDERHAAEAGRRFSAVATVCVAAMAATGAALFVGLFGWDPAVWAGILGSSYGVLLLLMVVLGLAMAGLGALNRYVHLARLLRASVQRTRAAFRANVWREATVGLAVLLVAAGLTNLPPVLGSEMRVAAAQPLTGEAVYAACEDAQEPPTCYADVLMALQAVRGPGFAFDVLADMAEGNATFATTLAHAIAHDLGHDALQNFGSVQTTLARCSDRVFQGCIHGALLAYFESLPSVDRSLVAGVCDMEGSPSRSHVINCYHGVGHGLLVSSGFDLNSSLSLCDSFPRVENRNTCYGGVFMENMDSYRANLTGVARESVVGHDDHGGKHGVADPANLAYPCDAILEDYRRACWIYQPGIVLLFSDNNVKTTAEACARLPGTENLTWACFRGVGGVLAFAAAEDPVRYAGFCALSPLAEGRAWCVRSFGTTFATSGTDPAPILPLCAKLAKMDQEPCYEGAGKGAAQLLAPESVPAFCRSAGVHEAACLRAAASPDAW